MRLKNKKTGEIGNLKPYDGDGKIWVWIDNISRPEYRYNSLAKLNEEWEDYEEPKGTYFINTQGDVQFWDSSSFAYPNDWTKEKEIGNYFNTQEEAEKAVEKLKAWKRLKDKGFKFIDHIDRDSGQGMTRYEWDGYINGEDLDLLFGGEE